jgi:transposase
VTTEQTVGFADEMRLGLVGQTRKVWAPVGVKVVQPLPYERRWCYVVLVVDGREGRVWWSWTTSMTADALQPEVARWHEAGIEAVVWDGAPAHQRLAAQGQAVVLVRQPPHSPELNPAERLILEIRRHVEGQVYATMSEKYAAVDAFLEDLNAHPERVRSLTGWHWIRDGLSALPSQNAA